MLVSSFSENFSFFKLLPNKIYFPQVFQFNSSNCLFFLQIVKYFNYFKNKNEFLAKKPDISQKN